MGQEDGHLGMKGQKADSPRRLGALPCARGAGVGSRFAAARPSQSLPQRSAPAGVLAWQARCRRAGQGAPRVLVALGYGRPRPSRE